MNKPKFTPGPWLPDCGKYIPIVALVNGKPAQIGRAESFGQISAEECEANGRLMAAAPELFEELEALTLECEHYGHGTERARELLKRILDTNEEPAPVIRGFFKNPEKPDIDWTKTKPNPDYYSVKK